MDQIKQAINILIQGGIIIYPTDTAFGIGCRLDSQAAVKRLFEIKKRQKTQAVPMLVDSIAHAVNYFQSPLPYNVRHLIEKYWPGALTVVYPCQKAKVPPLVRGGGENIGIRMPNNQTALSLIKGVGIPILGPSANFHGEETPFSYNQINNKLKQLVDFTLQGECIYKSASTVVDCSKTPWQVLRSGVINLNINDLSGKIT